MKRHILKIIVVFVLAVAATAGAKVFDDPAGAGMYNEKGVKAFNDGAYKAAISYLEQGYRINPNDKVIRKNLSVAYEKQGEIEYQAKNLSQAQLYLQSALSLDPENVNALVMMGDINYLSQNMDGAKAMWEKILKVDPKYKYKEKLKERLDKLNKEAKVEKEYRTGGMDQFEIRYAREGARLSYNIRYYLQEAYRLLGQDFNYRPDYKIVVVISDREQFSVTDRLPATTQAVYDGKIRLPLIGADYTPDHIRGLVWHEYTHLLVEDLSQGRAPIWLNEGLAYYEGFKYMDKHFATLKAAVRKGTLIPLGGLDGKLEAVKDQDQYWLACEESYTIANYMMKRYNKYTIREILRDMGKGETFGQVMKRKFNVSMKEFEKRWLTELNQGKLY